MSRNQSKNGHHQRSIVTIAATAGAVAFAALIATGLRADVPHTFAGGQTLTATQLNDNFAALDQRTTQLEGAQAVPPGTVIAYAGVVGPGVDPPAGWLLCDGSPISRTTYAALFSAIGTTAGGGDGATTFNLPDYRGRFLRGLDQGAGRDPDAPSRAAMAVGGNTGDAVGTVEGFDMQSHSHGVNDPGHTHEQLVTANPGSCPGSGIIRLDFGGDVPGNACAYDQGQTTAGSATGITLAASGGSETRPRNAAVNYLVKY